MTEPDGFADFVSAHSRSMLRTAYLLTGDAHLAADLVQESLARLWPRWDRVRDGHPEAYLRTIMVHLHSSWWRRKWRGEIPSESPPDRARTTDGVVPERLDVDLARALLTLPVGQRRVVVLRYAEDLSVDQVAAELGCSTGTVKSQASKGLARLREALGDPMVAEGVT